MSSNWAILGIERTADARLIKKAYAKKLKQVRPDEKPEEFQQLHFAYKSALQEASWLAARAEDPPLGESHADTSGMANGDENRPEASPDEEAGDDAAAGLRLEHHAPQPNIELMQPAVEYRFGQQRLRSDTSDYQTEIDRILSRAETTLISANAHEVDAWRFVLESALILDQEFLDQLGLALLRRVARYFNQEEFFDRGDFGIGVEVLHHLNSLFRWDQYEYTPDFYLQNDYGMRLFRQIENYSSKTESIQRDITSDLRGAKSVKKVVRRNQAPLREYYFGNGIKRVTALTIDLTIATLLAFPVILLIDKTIGRTIAQTEDFRLLMAYGTYLVGAWLFESSRFQATPGKKMLGLRVITRNQGRLGYFHGLLRVAVFALSCVGGSITLLINALTAGHFLHDRITRSHVIDLWRSYREQEKA
ncbi:MAG: RDD family protein [Candidatus Thiodiazotropha sp.]